VPRHPDRVVFVGYRFLLTAASLLRKYGHEWFDRTPLSHFRNLAVADLPPH